MKILGIGNAIVDVLCKVSDEFLTQHSLTKSTMKLINEVEFKKILTDTDNSLTKQYIELIKTEGVDLFFTDDGIEKICSLAEEVNFNVENIGARRLHTILEKVLETVSFDAPELKGKKVVVDAKLVEKHVGSLSKTDDLRKYVL